MVMYPRIWKASGFLTTFDHNFDQNGGESGRKYRTIWAICGEKSEKNGLKRAITSQKREIWTFGSKWSLRPLTLKKARKSEENGENTSFRSSCTPQKRGLTTILTRIEKSNIFTFGVWHSLVVRMVRDHEAAGSNPVTPTKKQPILR